MTGISLVHHFLEKSAGHFPEKTAAIYEKKQIGYAQLNSYANKLAHLLLDAGVRPGDRIVILSENSIEYIFCYYGIQKAGAIAVPLNAELKPNGLADLLSILEPRLLIVSSLLEKTVRSLDPALLEAIRILVIESSEMDQCPTKLRATLYEQLRDRSDKNPDLNIDPGSCAGIIFTSGSEGKPKGVMLSHNNIVANTRSIVEYLGLTAQDIQMVVLPFHYVMGKSLLNTHISVGGEVVINNKFAYTASVLKQMAEEGVTGFSGVPSTYAHLLFKSPLIHYREKLPALRYCSQAGGHMPRQIKLELLKALPDHTKLIIMYGATEAAARLTYLPPESLRSKIDSIGKAIPGVTLNILSPEGMPFGPGEVGELVARGDNIMLGYYRDKEGTNKVLDPHGYHTGDLGYIDEDGFLFVTGRKDDQVKVGGHRINPREVEDVIVASGCAMECTVFSIADVYLGSKLVGMVVPIPKLTGIAERIQEYCHQRLPKYKIPDPLLIVDSIPKTGSGKPDRAKSLELLKNAFDKSAKPKNISKEACHDDP